MNNNPDPDPGASIIDLGADHEERKRLHFWHRGRLPINKAIMRCGKTLSPAEKLVFLYVIERAGDGECRARQITIAEDLGLDERTVRRCLKELQTRTFIWGHTRPENPRAVVYAVNLENIYRWVDTGHEARNIPDMRSGTDRTSDPVIPDMRSGDLSNKDTETGTATEHRPAPAHEGTLENDTVKTLLLQVRREGDDVLAAEFRMIVEAHGAEVVLDVAARMSMTRLTDLTGPAPRWGRQLPWPSKLLEWLPENAELRAKLKPPKGRQKPLPAGVLSGQEVGDIAQRRAAEDQAVTLEGLRAGGVTEEEIDHWKELSDAGDDQADQYFQELDAKADAAKEAMNDGM